MRAEKNSKLATLETVQVSGLKAGEFVPVAIPARFEDAAHLKADLQASDIPAWLESDLRPDKTDSHHGVPVLVPECHLEQASEIVGHLELNSADDDDDDFEEVEEHEDIDELEDLDELEDEEDEFDEDEDEDEEDDDLDFNDDEEDDDDDDFFHNGEDED